MKRLLRIPEDTVHRATRRLDLMMAIAAVIGLGSLIAEHGFYLDEQMAYIVRRVDLAVVLVFVVHRAGKAVLAPDLVAHVRTHKLDFALVGLILLSVLVLANLMGSVVIRGLMEALQVRSVARIYVAIAQVYILLNLALSAVRYSQRTASLRIRPALTLLLSFLLVILLGTALLMLPRATVDRQFGIIDALFTATSATCVTGLIVVDTASHFTGFGQTVILGLIQVGGLGIMTFTTFVALFAGGGIGIREQVLMRDFLSEENIGSIGGTIRKILLMTCSIELAGAVALYYGWGDDVAPAGFERLSVAAFHAVSAFCNAGFALFTDGMADTRLAETRSATLVVAILVILGGLGFTVVTNVARVARARLRRKPGPAGRLSVHSKLVLVTSAALLAGGTVLFALLETDGVLAGMSFTDRLVHSFFSSVSTRTAGFNTVNFGALMMPTTLLVIVLMFIGASPGSTGGGIKTTTFSVGLMTIYALCTGRTKVEMFRRQISEHSILRAYVTIMLSIATVATAVFLLTMTEFFPFRDLVFEAVSAFATVGLTRGITSALSDAGKVIITITMIIGRVGALTLALALIPGRDDGAYDFPRENVTTT